MKYPYPLAEISAVDFYTDDEFFVGNASADSGDDLEEETRAVLVRSAVAATVKLLSEREFPPVFAEIETYRSVRWLTRGDRNWDRR